MMTLKKETDLEFDLEALLKVWSKYKFNLTAGFKATHFILACMLLALLCGKSAFACQGNHDTLTAEQGRVKLINNY